MRVSKWRGAIVILAILAVTASACSSSKKSTTAGATGGGKVADSYVLGTTDSLQNSFDPAQAYDVFGADVVWNTAETLVTYASQLQKAGHDVSVLLMYLHAEEDPATPPERGRTTQRSDRFRRAAGTAQYRTQTIASVLRQ